MDKGCNAAMRLCCPLWVSRNCSVMTGQLASKPSLALPSSLTKPFIHNSTPPLTITLAAVSINRTDGKYVYLHNCAQRNLIHDVVCLSLIIYSHFSQSNTTSQWEDIFAVEESPLAWWPGCIDESGVCYMTNVKAHQCFYFELL